MKLTFRGQRTYCSIRLDETNTMVHYVLLPPYKNEKLFAVKDFAQKQFF